MSITEPKRSSLGKEVGTSRGNDRISLLPDSLLCHILSFLTWKEAVSTSFLSSRWRDPWKWVLRLELDNYKFPTDKACVDFISKFLLNVKSLSEFNLFIAYDNDLSLYEPCLVEVMKFKIQHFHVDNCGSIGIPLTLSACESLVSLKLSGIRLNDFASLSLPCLKIMDLDSVIFAHDVVLGTPRLEHLSLKNCQFKSFEIKRMSGSIKVHIDICFGLRHYDLSERNIIYNFLKNFSAVEDVTLAESTLLSIYFLRDMYPLPKFHGLTTLRATIWLGGCLILLPILLKSCPNLKRLTLILSYDDIEEAVTGSLSRRLPICLVSSIEYVEIETTITEEATEQEVVRYFLGNATSLKKLVLRLDVSDEKKHDPVLVKQRFDSPGRSNLCQFEVLLRSCPQ
ncbi:F-box/FBD/LRR-repeat protein [Raphanus sativus]|uniref:F-box/FBD/LRR-repeat protein At5g18770-like n=1 Tax=Raphanus sativus TaxID=3726 RepID=A0A6J0MME9_RAPSA|nr:F-box/FBD/LRR-repeat protein At5g18770-like [Raphanus sativus]KAJ4868932.1 F-box/FBD/LRR-repeat protein [Raphanus sativus]